MIKGLRGRLKRTVFCGAALAALASCAVEPAQDARYGPGDCQQTRIIDSVTGDLIRGAEDLEIDFARRLLYFSAYDRRSVERAARRRAFKLPEGGVYAVSLDDLVGEPGEVQARPLVNADDVGGGLRPHGISYNEATGEIAFINRAYQRLDGRWKMSPRIERFGVDGAIVMADDATTPCAANDLVDELGRTLISFDHEQCNWRASLEDALSLRRSGIARETGEAVYDRALYANGIARLDSGEVALAATREKSILIMDETGAGLTLRERIAMPGGPDNLTRTPDGKLVAALHPSLGLMALHRRLGLGAAPSRIVKIDPETATLEVIFDDPFGEVFSAASAAVEWSGAMIAGSATDEGLLVCKAAG